MGICILWIMLFHAGISAPRQNLLRAMWYVLVDFGGGIGVDIFLICSGLGLACSSIKRERNNSILTLKAFYLRRFSRIIPSYLIVAGCYYFLQSLLSLVPWRILYNLFFLNFIFEGERDFWYIVATLFFYLLYPFYYRSVKR